MSLYVCFTSLKKLGEELSCGKALFTRFTSPQHTQTHSQLLFLLKAIAPYWFLKHCIHFPHEISWESRFWMLMHFLLKQEAKASLPLSQMFINLCFIPVHLVITEQVPKTDSSVLKAFYTKTAFFELSGVNWTLNLMRRTYRLTDDTKETALSLIYCIRKPCYNFSQKKCCILKQLCLLCSAHVSSDRNVFQILTLKFSEVWCVQTP